jgi:hypothetical protein
MWSGCIVVITNSYKENISGVLHCYDRVNINATAGTFGYPEGMTSFFFLNGFKIFEGEKF